MAKKKPDKVCSDCIHFNACGLWTIKILDNTDAGMCSNYETAIIDRDKPMVVIREPWSVNVNGAFIDGEIDNCPNCGNTELDEGQIFCQVCGQALDWR